MVQRVGPVVARVLLGLMFTVTGSNGFLHFLPMPQDGMSPGAASLMKGFMDSGYMMPLIMGTQLVSGLLLLSGFFVPLALALLAPVLVNIFAFHAFLAPAGIGAGVVTSLLELYLVWSYRIAFEPMLAARAKRW